MPKYYIESGHLKIIITEENYVDAILRVLKNKIDKDSSMMLGASICVNEQGFLSELNNCFSVIKDEKLYYKRRDNYRVIKKLEEIEEDQLKLGETLFLPTKELVEMIEE